MLSLAIFIILIAVATELTSGLLGIGGNMISIPFLVIVFAMPYLSACRHTNDSANHDFRAGWRLVEYQNSTPAYGKYPNYIDAGSWNKNDSIKIYPSTQIGTKKQGCPALLFH